jgi:endonuclease/exonuclease/phosphatase family metal-dependent hydrolase
VQQQYKTFVCGIVLSFTFAVHVSMAQAEEPVVFFYEDCGNSAPSADPRPTPGSYQGWSNFANGNIVFSGTSDVRSTSAFDSHVWFGTGKVRTLIISGINSSDYSNITLGFKIVGNLQSGATVANVSDFFTVTCTDAANNSYPVALPNMEGKYNLWANYKNLTGAPSTGNLTITITCLATNTVGFRLDDVKLAGIPKFSSQTPQTVFDFKVITYNTRWLSCSTTAPNDDALQINNIAYVISELNPDLIALQEVGTSSSYATIDTLVKRLGSAYEGSIIPWNNSNCSQNQGIIYKKSKVQFVSHSLMTNAGSSVSWSSGRFPALYELNLLAGNNTVPLSVVNIHAKASVDAATATEDLARRKDASVSLKALLDGSSWDGKNVLFIGDFNDYLIGNQCASCSDQDSPYKNFVDDVENYWALSKDLRDSDSPVIDNIIISNELFDFYLPNSIKRENSSTKLVADYINTTSDHTPVSMTLRITVPDTSVSVSPREVSENDQVSVNQNQIVIENSTAQPVAVYDIMGRKIFSAPAIVHAIIPVSQRGIYIIQIGQNKYKAKV